MPRPIERRQFLSAAGAVAARGAVNACRTIPTSIATPHAPALPLMPMRMDRVTRLTVCTRSFRPLGPRLETEKIGEKTVVHNCGHGGSGWSLSWGSASVATGKVLETGARDVAVIGAGIIGLTTALPLQRAGLHVTIYAKELAPNVRFSLYQRILMQDYAANGGRVETTEFHTPNDVQRVRERTVVNATGCGAPALMSDDSIVPVRGQLTRRIPQADVHYSVSYKDVSFLPRRDGFVIQAVGDSDYHGDSIEAAVADRAEAEHGVTTVASLHQAEA